MANSVVKFSVNPPSTFLDTPTSKRILDVLEYCRAQRTLCAIVGAPGVGKSESVKEDARRHERERTIMATSNHFASTAIQLAELIKKDIPGYARTAKEVYDRLAFGMPPASLLVIDEAQHLSDSAIEMLRWANDAGGVAIALVGNEKVVGRYREAKVRADFAQFLSRIEPYVRIGPPTSDDYEVLFAHHKIAGLRLRKKIREAKPGDGLRGVAKVINLARHVAGPDRAIEDSHVDAAIRFIHQEETSAP